LSVEAQVIQIYAVTKGLTDDVKSTAIQAFSTGLIAYVEQHANDLLDKIRTEKAFDDAWEAKLKTVIADFKATLPADQKVA
jgi:F0F1-type ATP synthase alpha subunit